MQDCGLVPADWQVLVGLGTYIYRHGNAFPSNATLATFLGLTRETVNRSLGVLRVRGYIEKAGTRNRCVIYRLPGMCDPVGHTTGETCDLGGVEVCAVGSQDPVTHEVTLLNKTYKNPPVVPPTGGQNGADASRAGTYLPTPSPSPMPGEGSSARQADGAGGEAWREVRNRLRKQLGDAAFKSWIGQVSVAGIDGGRVKLTAKSRFICDQVDSRYGTELRDALSHAMPGFLSVEFIAPGAQPGG